MNSLISSRGNLSGAISKVSIGLPVHNGERYLRSTLLSLVSQDYPNLEIVISDNASTDGTAEIIEEFASQYSSIRLITHDSLLSAADNFSFVLEASTGDYFCWAADDDIRSPGSIAAMAATLDRHSELVCVMTDVVNLEEETQKLSADRLEGIRLETVLADWPKVRRLFFEVPTSNIFFAIYGLYRIKVIRAIRMNFNLGFSANTEIPILAQVALKGAIASLPVDGFIYRRHSQSTYHLEVAGEGPEVQRHRNKVIRGVLGKMVLTSSFPLSEKAFLLRELWRGHRRDRPVEQESPEKLARARARKKRMKKKEKARQNLFKKVRSRIQRAIFGSGASKPEGKNAAKLEAKHEAKMQAAMKETPSDEEIVAAWIDLEAVAQRGLIRREAARRRLESKGWRFKRETGMGLILDHGITSVIDCGANCGQFVEALQQSGWSGQVHSFEPLAGAYEVLAEKARAVGGWRTFPFALGEARGEAEIKVAGNSYSSSLLNFSAEFEELQPEAKATRTETIQVRRLDEFIEEEGLTFTGPILLKLDVQGFELQVMRGAGNLLDRVELIQTEMAFVPSYEGAPTFAEVKEFLNERGFVLVHLLDGHANPRTGELREVDGIFVNTKRERERAGAQAV